MTPVVHVVTEALLLKQLVYSLDKSFRRGCKCVCRIHDKREVSHAIYMYPGRASHPGSTRRVNKKCRFGQTPVILRHPARLKIPRVGQNTCKPPSLSSAYPLSTVCARYARSPLLHTLMTSAQRERLLYTRNMTAEGERTAVGCADVPLCR